MCCRIIVFRPSSKNASTGTISHLHVVDLIGSWILILIPFPDSLIGAKSTDTLQHRQLSEQDRIARREHAIQLQSLFKVLSEVRDISRSAALSKSLSGFREPVAEQLRLTSARDSKLTLLLGTIRTSSLFKMTGI